MILDAHRAALIIFIAAAVTDFLDGWIARKFGFVTDFGKLIDPLADKILVMTALVMLVGEGISTGVVWVPDWLVVLILAREIWVTGLRAVAATMGKVIPAGKSGKLKSFLQMAAVVGLLMHGVTCVSISGHIFTYDFIGLRLLVISVIFSYLGAIDYTSQVLKSDS